MATKGFWQIRKTKYTVDQVERIMASRMFVSYAEMFRYLIRAEYERLEHPEWVEERKH